MKAVAIALLLFLGWIFAVPYCGPALLSWVSFCLGVIVYSAWKGTRDAKHGGV